MQIRITAKAIVTAQAQAKETGKAVYLWDEILSGFGAYVSPKGSVSWLIQKWQGGRAGKATRVAIGSTRNGMPLEDARKAAQADLGELAKGVNLVEKRAERRKKLAKDLHVPNLSKAWEKFWQAHQKGTRYWTEMNQNVVRCITEAGLETPLQTVKKQDVKSWLAKRDGQGAKRTLFAALRPFFAWCVDEDWLPVSPMAGLKSPKPVASRARSLKPDEIRTYWAATQKLEYPWKHYFLLLLLLGQRRQEVSGLRNDELDLEQAIWTIPGERTKNAKEHIVHLSPVAISIITEALEKQAELEGRLKPKRKGNFVWVLTTTCKGPIKGYSKAKKALDKEMKELGQEKPFRIHDLRRTMVSTLAPMGVSTDVADRLLNHISGSSQSGVKGVYQQYEFLDERKAAILLWSKEVARMLKVERKNQKAASVLAGEAQEEPGPIIKASDSEPISVAEAPEIPLKRTRARKALRKARSRQDNEAIPC